MRGGTQFTGVTLGEQHLYAFRVRSVTDPGMKEETTINGLSWQAEASNRPAEQSGVVFHAYCD